MKKIAALVCCGCAGLFLHAQDEPAPSPTPSTAPAPPVAATPVAVDETVRQMVQSFFDGLHDNEVNRAYDQLIKFSPIADRAEDVALLKSKTGEAIKQFGSILGGEIVATKNVGTHLLRATAVSIGGRYPLRWRFYFYRATDTWRLIDIRVDDRLAGMFDEAEPSPTPSVDTTGK